MKHRECDNVGPIDFKSRNHPPTSAVESQLSGLLWNVSFCTELPLGVCSSSYRVLSRTSPLIKVSAEDNRTRLRFQLRTIGHIALVGCARKCEGGCSILHSSHWDSLEDLSQTSGSGQFFLEQTWCAVAFLLASHWEIGRKWEVVFTLSHIRLLT